MKESKIPATRLTVIIRDDSPIIFAADSPTYRRVTFDLTPEQQEKIKVFEIGKQGGKPIFEDISKAFLED